MKKIAAWQTHDGLIFMNQDDAQAHEDKLERGCYVPTAEAIDLGELQRRADELYDLKARKSALKKSVEAFDERSGELERLLINNVSKSGGGVIGRVAKAAVLAKVVPTVEDWPALYAYIKKTGRFDLLHRRISVEPVQEIWEAKKTVPGVGQFTSVKLSLTKR